MSALVRPRGAATLVAAGILLSRIAGFVRESVFGYYFGVSAAADAFKQAFKVTNFLQNLFGEGVLSASFIPVYAGLLAHGEEQEAGQVAGAVLAILGLVTSVVVLLGVLAAPLLVDVIAYGFQGEKRELTIHLVRILFPGAGLLVMSAWCLGVLNSHRKFFLSYSIGVLWNVVMIGALLLFGSRSGELRLVSIFAASAVVASMVQFFVQLPVVLKLVPHFKVTFSTHLASVRTVVRNFGPVFVSRGVVQISAFIDSILASPIPGGASILAYVATVSALPVSLFGMSVSASELPEMSSAEGGEAEVAAFLRKRLFDGLRRITFFVIPSVVAFVGLGDMILAPIYQRGKFTEADTAWAWGVLAGSGVGLLASTQGRLYSSTFYALKDTRTPLRFAVIRIALTTILGYISVKQLPVVLALDPRWGIAGLTASAGISGWVEFALLRRALARKIGSDLVGARHLLRLWAIAILAAGIAWGIKLGVPLHGKPVLAGLATLIPFGAVYLLLADFRQIRKLLRRN